MKGVKVFSISQRALKDTWVCLPSLSVQNEIAAYLDRQSAKIKSITEDTHTSIALLKERRSALISAAVTGKIDVRETV
jgi:type I restriction enzyme S subunit